MMFNISVKGEILKTLTVFFIMSALVIGTDIIFNIF